jgi:hypothetical protein
MVIRSSTFLTVASSTWIWVSGKSTTTAIVVVFPSGHYETKICEMPAIDDIVDLASKASRMSVGQTTYDWAGSVITLPCSSHVCRFRDMHYASLSRTVCSRQSKSWPSRQEIGKVNFRPTLERRRSIRHMDQGSRHPPGKLTYILRCVAFRSITDMVFRK